MEKYVDPQRNIKIVAKEISLGGDVTFGNNIDIRLHGNFCVGDRSRIGSNAVMTGNNVTIGTDLYNSSGFTVGGGGSQNPDSDLIIGDRCVIHNSYINTAAPVRIGDDVGFSNHVDIITHGFWASVLDGFPASFEGVTIGNNVIFGYRTSILMGADICDDVVVGAHSVVGKSLTRPGVYAGAPAKFLRDVVALSGGERVAKLNDIIEKYRPIAAFHQVSYTIEVSYPVVRFNEFVINVETFEYQGPEDEHSDDFRDFLRKWGIRVYTGRPFKSRLGPPGHFK